MHFWANVNILRPSYNSSVIYRMRYKKMSGKSRQSGSILSRKVKPAFAKSGQVAHYSRWPPLRERNYPGEFRLMVIRMKGLSGRMQPCFVSRSTSNSTEGPLLLVYVFTVHSVSFMLHIRMSACKCGEGARGGCSF